MKLYNSIGPNPRVVKMFIAEKGLNIPREQVDLMSGENRQDAYKTLNPSGTTPALETDEGVFLAEITAVCEYLEELHPNPPLIGTTPMQRAETRMWCRRIDLNIIEGRSRAFRAYMVGRSRYTKDNLALAVRAEGRGLQTRMAQDGGGAEEHQVDAVLKSVLGALAFVVGPRLVVGEG